MILADKIIRLRKRNGWSQEELAEKMDVSRQAVSKWEAAQSTPELEKILQLSSLFEVSTDFLLKDELEEEDFVEDRQSEKRTLTMESMDEYLKLSEFSAGKTALVTFLCVISPICLILLAALSEITTDVSETFAAFTGLVVLLLTIAVAVGMFIYVGSKNSKFKYLENENFSLAYGVLGAIKEKQRKYKDTYTKRNIISVTLFILAPIILFIGMLRDEDIINVVLLCIMLLVVAIGAYIVVKNNIYYSAMERLLKEGEFKPKQRKKNYIKSTLGTIYWLVATAIYLFFSFTTRDWKSTWIVWPIAGVLYAALMGVVNLVVGEE